MVGKLAEGDNYCRMFKWSELRELISLFPFKIIEALAYNYLWMDHRRMIKKIGKDADTWKRFLKWELEFC